MTDQKIKELAAPYSKFFRGTRAHDTNDIDMCFTYMSDDDEIDEIVDNMYIYPITIRGNSEAIALVMEPIMKDIEKTLTDLGEKF